jgi:hypothetical protein
MRYAQTVEVSESHRHLAAELRSRYPRAVIDWLEPRRMLASFDGTFEADTFKLFSDGLDLHVVVNGVDHVTRDSTVFIFAGSGNDVVYLGALQGSPASTNLIDIRAGGGDDRITNYDPVSNTGSLDDVRMRMIIRGGSGNDTLGVDDSDGLVVVEGEVLWGA